jgi:hypothetical protein
MVISNKKNKVINTSRYFVTDNEFSDKSNVFAPISSAEIMMTIITKNSKSFFSFKLNKDIRMDSNIEVQAT